jgi:hypothetical protein
MNDIYDNNKKIVYNLWEFVGICEEMWNNERVTILGKENLSVELSVSRNEDDADRRELRPS